MRIKMRDDDFVVEEIASDTVVPDGQFALVHVTKRSMTSEDAAAIIAQRLHLSRKALAYAGAKDAHAVTTQRMTLPASAEPRIAFFAHERIALRAVGRVREPLALGMLEGNRFRIVVRDLAPNDLCHALGRVPNYFDEQRFSGANAVIGRNILQGKLLNAAKTVIESDGIFGPKLAQHLEQHRNDAVGALRLLPRHTLLMFVHAYQSLLFNDVLSRYILLHDPAALRLEGPIPLALPGNDVPGVHIPIVGFASKLEPPFDAWYAQLLAGDGLDARSFVVRAIPFLSLEGSARDALVPLAGLTIGLRDPDELHEGKEKQELSFTLPKASYATIAIKCLYRTGLFDAAGEEKAK